MKLLVLLYALKLIWALEVVPESYVLEYINHKYLKFLSVTFRRHSRHGPHYVNLEVESLVGVGNNLTLKMALYELLAGHYVPTPIILEHQLCDFLYKEPFVGRMFAKQLPANFTCPFPRGEYHYMNLTMHLENFPQYIPFTYSSMIVRTRADVQGIFTTTNEEVFRWKTNVKVTQKLQKKSSIKSITSK